MKHITLITCLFLLSFAYSQENIKGYYVSAAGQRTDGYFKVSYYQDENTLRFSPTAEGNFEKLNTASVNEYGIADDYKFVKQIVQMDRSNIDGEQLSLNKEPNFETVTVFLNVLVEGDASLYSYSNGGSSKYFYKIGSQQVPTRQLVYKKYRPTASTTAENNQFRQQLYADLKCGSDDISKFTSIRYSKKDIVPLFTEFNNCVNSDSKQYDKNDAKQAKLYFSVFAGLYNSTYNVKSPRSKTEDDTKLTYSVGLEGNYVFVKNFGIFARVEYEINSKWELTTPAYNYEISNNINFFIGPRYILNIAEKSKLYVDASMLISVVKGNVGIKIFQLDDHGVLLEDELDVPLKNALAFNMGAGYVFNDKFAVEVRMETNRNYLADNNLNIQSKHTRLGLNLKYTIN